MAKLTELRTPEEQKKYEQWQAWLTDYAKKFHNNSNKRKLDITQIMSEIDRLYPENKLRDSNENI